MHSPETHRTFGNKKALAGPLIGASGQAARLPTSFLALFSFWQRKKCIVPPREKESAGCDNIPLNKNLTSKLSGVPLSVRTVPWFFRRVQNKWWIRVCSVAFFCLLFLVFPVAFPFWMLYNRMAQGTLRANFLFVFRFRFWNRIFTNKKAPNDSELGANDGTRTHDLLITNQLLYRLSHISKGTIEFCLIMITYKNPFVNRKMKKT